MHRTEMANISGLQLITTLNGNLHLLHLQTLHTTSHNLGFVLAQQAHQKDDQQEANAIAHNQYGTLATTPALIVHPGDVTIAILRRKFKLAASWEE